MKIQRAIVVNGSLFLKKAGLGSRIIVLKFTLTPRLYRFLLSKKKKSPKLKTHVLGVRSVQEALFWLIHSLLIKNIFSRCVIMQEM